MPVFMGTTGLVLNESLLWERGRKGRSGFSLPRPDVERRDPPAARMTVTADNAQRQLANTDLKAPIAGTVLTVLAQPGEGEQTLQQRIGRVGIELDVDARGRRHQFRNLPGAFAVHGRALTMDPMVETTADQPDPYIGTGRTFDAGMMTAGITYARSFTDKFSAGVTGNLISEGLAEYTQQTFAFDIGTLYDVGVLGMRIGMAISNIGEQVQFIDREARLPTIFRVGTSAILMQRAEQKLVGAFEFSHPPDNSERLNVGAEYSFRKYLFLRGGYNINYDSEGLAGGVGFHFPVSVAGMADLDYAYTDMKDLGAVHRFSLGFVF